MSEHETRADQLGTMSELEIEREKLAGYYHFLHVLESHGVFETCWYCGAIVCFWADACECGEPGSPTRARQLADLLIRATPDCEAALRQQIEDLRAELAHTRAAWQGGIALLDEADRVRRGMELDLAKARLGAR